MFLIKPMGLTKIWIYFYVACDLSISYPFSIMFQFWNWETIVSSFDNP